MLLHTCQVITPDNNIATVFKHKINMGKYTEKQNHNVKYKQLNLIRNNNNTSDVLEHKWRASLKTILFLYE